MTPGSGNKISLLLRLRDLETMIVDETAMQDGIKGGQVCISQQPAMKIPVELGEPVFIAGARSALHVCNEALEVRNERPAWMLDGPDHSTTFYGLPQSEHLHRFVGGAARDARAPVPLADNESLLLQLKKSLTHRTLAAAKETCKLHFGQRLSRREFAQHDVPLHGLINLT
jgi:hypothetical protein